MTDEHITAYLLGELSEEESERFEEECFAQESWPAQIDSVEEDLIDDYLRDRLTPERRRNFKRSYLTTPARVERFLMASALLRHVDARTESVPEPSPEPAPPPGLTWAERLRALWRGRPWVPRTAVALAALAVVATLWWAARPRPPQTFATMTLTAGVSNRAEGVRAGRVTLPLDADALKISLVLPEGAEPAARYRVELESGGGQALPLEASGPEAGAVSVVIPAAQLARGSYALKLFAVPADGPERRIPGSYFFTAE